MSDATPLARIGSFFAGGRIVEVTGRPTETVRISETVDAFAHDPNGHYAVEGCYVQYAIPEKPRAAILLVHGGGLSGSCWETTPDERPGWQELLLKRGYAVYIVDMVERGRAGWCPLPEVWPGTPILRTLEEAWRVFRLGRPEDFAARRPFEGQRFPVEVFERFALSGVPRWPGESAAAQAALAEALERIGPCHVIGHSSGSGAVYRLMSARPDLVRTTTQIEPADFPDIPAPGFAPLLHVFGDFIERSDLWSDLRRRADAYLRDTVESGRPGETLTLAQHGLPGHSHMPMMDRGSDAALKIVLARMQALESRRQSRRS